ncbi:helix-turn-helix DNA-binding domain protein [Mycobacterium phage Avocado]|uniref:Helix-turn-helix DNA binding domain protein n=1 Tax=Mycobacterium phage Avocado TaxID=2024302 RepID=A0A222YZ93_9CAUD|nr:helix-turn-helix DNA binding domain protein [Mycobacterium phage Avocado]ASR77243.1 helix-turn-helix DNA-binding domain protein [Mycobacterium phage Avocado]
MITSKVVTLSPADARDMLTRNTHNRPPREGDVLKWAAEMEAGLWQMNGEPIKFGESGRLMDGQHRLMALAMQDEKVRVSFLLVCGLPDDTQKTMDQGRARSLSDVLTLDGLDVSRSHAGAIRAYLLWSEGLMFVDRNTAAAKLTNPYINRWAQENPDALDLLRRGMTYRKIRARGALVAAIFARIAEVQGVDVADEFFQRVSDGLNQSAGSPIMALRGRLDNIAGDNKNGVKARISDRDVIGMFVTAFNAWIAGRTLAKIQRPTRAGYTAALFPTIAEPTR